MKLKNEVQTPEIPWYILEKSIQRHLEIGKVRVGLLRDLII